MQQPGSYLLEPRHARFFEVRDASRSPVAHLMTMLMASVFALVEILWITHPSNGAFLDEGTYITAGLRTLHGHGISDGYLTWFAGSLVWPVLSGAAYALGGLEGSRLLACGCVTVACWGSISAARRLYGDVPAAWTAVILFTSAPALMLAHLAVYDVLAAAALGITFWAVAKLADSDNRGWLIIIGAAGALAVLSKYPVIVMVGVLLLLLVVLRGRRGLVDASIALMIVVGVLTAYFLPFRSELIQFVGWRAANNPGFGVTRQMIGFEQVLLLGPVALLALVGALRLPRVQRASGMLLCAALFVFPAYHVLIGNDVGASKHAFFGLMLAAPVGGYCLHRLTSRTRWLRMPLVMLASVAMAAGSAAMVWNTDHGWVDMRPAQDYLADHMQAGDTLLASNSWPVVPELYHDKLITDPAQVTDGWTARRTATAIDWCGYDWVVDEDGGTGWSTQQRATLKACGSYRRVMRSPSELIALSPQLEYLHLTANAVVYENISDSR